MLVEYLVREDYIEYLKQQDPMDYPGHYDNRNDCPIMQYLKSLDILSVDSFSIDYNLIYIDDSLNEELPEWVTDYVNHIAKIEYLGSGLTIADCLRVLEEQTKYGLPSEVLNKQYA